MDSKQYIEQAKKTESKDFTQIAERLTETPMIRLLHGAMGVTTESGELLDAVKKHVFYGKPLDKTNLIEEMGDLFWYLAIMADELGVSFEEILRKNSEKLALRYGKNFSSTKAITRDLDEERKCLEN